MSNKKIIKNKEEILNSYGFDFDAFKLENEHKAKKLLNAMEEYSNQNCNEIYDLYNNSLRKLKPLEDLYRKENPRSDVQFYLPDTTKFYEWITQKIINGMSINLDEFKNNVFCRRDSNQHKATELWQEISKIIDPKDKMLFEIEWNHFLLKEIPVFVFALYFNKYVQKYY